MRSYQIITDSASDLGEDLRSAYNVEYCAMRLSWQGHDVPADLDWGGESARQYYAALRGGRRVAVSPVPEDEFRRRFEKCAGADIDVLYIGCSGALCDSYSVAVRVARAVMDDHPSVTIRCVDSLHVGLGEGMIAVAAALLREKEKSLDQTADYIEENRDHFFQFITTDKYRYLLRAGHVGAARAFWGALLDRRPILVADPHGRPCVAETVRRRVSALQALVRRTAQAVDPGTTGTFYVAHADCEREAEAVAAMLRQRLPSATVRVQSIGPVAGSIVGPGAVAVFGYAGELPR